MSPQWESRYYSFDAAWAPDEMMASMRDGSGDHWRSIICRSGVAIVGLAHESPTYTRGVRLSSIFAGLPSCFESNCLDEPAFDTANATFCVWRRPCDDGWQSAAAAGQVLSSDDGSDELLAMLEGRPQQYVEFAADYYECDVRRDDVAAVYEHQSIDADLIARLNPEADAREVVRELQEFGYPAR